MNKIEICIKINLLTKEMANEIANKVATIYNEKINKDDEKALKQLARIITSILPHLDEFHLSSLKEVIPEIIVKYKSIEWREWSDSSEWHGWSDLISPLNAIVSTAEDKELKKAADYILKSTLTSLASIMDVPQSYLHLLLKGISFSVIRGMIEEDGEEDAKECR